MNSRASKIPVRARVRIANRKDGKSFFRVLPLLACGNRGFKIPRRGRRLRKRHLKVSSSETSARLSPLSHFVQCRRTSLEFNS